jgi:hypothetical protein
MESRQSTLNVKGKGEAKTIFDSEHPYIIYQIEREQGESKTLVGYTTSQYECLVCQKLGMQWSFHGSYPSIDHLQNAKSEEHTAGQDRTFITETDKAAMIFMLTLTATLQAAGLGDGVMDGLPFADADQTSEHSASEVSEDA